MRTVLRSPQGIALSAGLALALLATVFGPALFGDAATARDIAGRQAPASPSHPFGTDDLGRDLFARTVVATRLSVLLTLGATVISVVGFACVWILHLIV